MSTHQKQFSELVIEFQLHNGALTHLAPSCQKTARQICDQDLTQCYELLRNLKREHPVKPTGSDFQRQVWRLLRLVPEGDTICYQNLANWMGNPKAVRAIGTAVGKNPISLLIPCHRVIQKSGKTGQYRWGADLKQRLLDFETTR
ncbi:MAG: MGMT family protein [Pseudomonadota bacterium]|nr:MGMT family protein [Pseudomonadota bacterium]